MEETLLLLLVLVLVLDNGKQRKDIQMFLLMTNQGVEKVAGVMRR